MADVPPNSFDLVPSDAPWEALREVVHCLNSDQPIPREIKVWLILAIELSNENPTKLLRGLGLAKQQGKPSPYPILAPEQWGGRAVELEDSGIPPESALQTVLAELATVTLTPPDRRTLQRWRNAYRRDERLRLELLRLITLTET